MVLFVIGMTALTSCSKGKEKLIIGKWELTSFSISGGGYDMEMTMQEFYELIGGDTEDMESLVLEFKNDGYVYMDDYRSPYSVEGDRLIVEVTDDEDGEVEYETMIIKELTEKAMTLEPADNIEDLGEDIKMAIHFKKV